MKNLSLLLVAFSLLGYSCNSSIKNVFSRKTPHEKYEDKLKDTGMSATPEGREWLLASERSLLSPSRVSVPFRMQGFFHADKPRALGMRFSAKRGERVRFELEKTGEFRIYADVFRLVGTEPVHLLAAETGEPEFGFNADETGDYIVRLQPEIAAAGPYTFNIESGPLFDFPVEKGRVGSVWGDSRDGGKRSHEGIDIFAPKGTPIIAIADGQITSVKEGGLGGKTVSLRPAGTNYSLYYAHLDEQLVSPGQHVKKGDVVGLVGNTGNARTTPPHLHFGIYTYGGAIDPLPFVNPKKKTTAASLPVKPMGSLVRVVKSHKTAAGVSLALNALLTPIAITAKGYFAETAGGEILEIPFSLVKATTEPVVKTNVVESAYRLKSTRAND